MAEKAEKKHPLQYRGKNAETAYEPKVRKAVSVKPIPIKKAEVVAKAPAPVAPVAPNAPKIEKKSVKGSKK